MREATKWKNFDMFEVKCKKCGRELYYNDVKEVTEFVIEGFGDYDPFGDRQGEIEFVFHCPECGETTDYEFAVMFEKMRMLETIE